MSYVHHFVNSTSWYRKIAFLANVLYCIVLYPTLNIWYRVLGVLLALCKLHTLSDVLRQITEDVLTIAVPF